MARNVVFDAEARERLAVGANTIGNAVRITMGPKGRAVLLPQADPVFTLDGVTVAKSIVTLKNPIEDMGAQLVKNVAQKTNDQAGDGTTTATLLTQELLREGLKGISNGVDPITMRRAFEIGAVLALKTIERTVTPVKKKEQMAAVATISSRDPEIGEVIAKIYEKIGKEGVITTEEVKTIVGIEEEFVEGMQVDSGWMVPHFMTNKERGVAVVEKPFILVTSQVISTNNDIAALLQQIVSTEKRAIVIIAEDITGEALATLAINALRRTLNIVAIKAPGFGENKEAHLEDICAITGATLVTEKTGLRVDVASIEHLGRADQLIAYKNRSIIVGGKGSKKAIAERKAGIKREIEEATSHYKKAILEKRHAKLSEGIAVIRVGDITEEASHEKQYRIEDAINATKSAIEEGVVEGGGLALYRASQALDAMIEKEKDADMRFGLQAFQKAIRAPARQILHNQGVNPDVTLHDAAYRLPADVMDPYKVVRIALQLASSTVGLFLITGAVVYDEPEEKKK